MDAALPICSCCHLRRRRTTVISSSHSRPEVVVIHAHGSPLGPATSIQSASKETVDCGSLLENLQTMAGFDCPSNNMVSTAVKTDLPGKQEVKRLHRNSQLWSNAPKPSLQLIIFEARASSPRPHRWPCSSKTPTMRMCCGP